MHCAEEDPLRQRQTIGLELPSLHECDEPLPVQEGNRCSTTPKHRLLNPWPADLSANRCGGVNLFCPQPLLSLLAERESSLQVGTIRGALQFAHLLFTKQCLGKKEARNSVTLNGEILEQTVIAWRGNNGAMRWLEEIGFFTRSGTPSDFRSYRYSVSPSFSWRAGVRWPLLRFPCPVLVRKSADNLQRRMKRELNLVESWLHNSLSSVTILRKEFDADFEREEENYKAKIKKRERVSRQVQKRWNGFVRAAALFDKFESDDWDLIVDDFAGRIHTPLTRLPKFARKYLRGPNGEPLVELDASSFQPLLCVLSAQRDGVSSPELLRLCESGEIYEWIQAECCFASRERAKRETLRLMYRSPYAKTSAVTKLFQEKFPEFVRWLEKKKLKGIVRHLTELRKQKAANDPTVKSASKKRRGKKRSKPANPGGRKLAAVMQRLERDVVIGPEKSRSSSDSGLCKRIWREHRKTFVMTIHDAVIVCEEDAQWVHEMFQSELKRAGANVTVRCRSIS